METHSLHKCAQSNVEYLQPNDLSLDEGALPPLTAGSGLRKLRLTHVSSEVLHMIRVLYSYLWLQQNYLALNGGALTPLTAGSSLRKLRLMHVSSVALHRKRVLYIRKAICHCTHRVQFYK
jgi:hypothetical protein